MNNELLRTPLYEVHVQEGAKIVEFAGWEMPIEYSGIKNEHLTVRSEAGIFDLSHMGEIDVYGPDALEFVNYLVTNEVSNLAEGQCLYSCMCRENGGIIDDLLVYRFPDKGPGDYHFWLIVNASNCDKDYAWVEEHKKGAVTVKNISAETALVAIQGPKSQEILQKFTKADLESLRYYHVLCGDFKGKPAVISRTGYTGEDGFEIYIANEQAAEVWKALREEGGCLPIGLGARDTLRLEAVYSLYGHEITDDTNPINTSLGWVVKLDGGDFIGRDALKKVKEAGAETAIVGLALQGRAIPRSGYAVNDPEGNNVGTVTSGTFSPSLGRGVCLALVKASCRKPGTELTIAVRSRQEKALVQRPPFVKGSVRR
ncbi:glycine cleavage system aminomethyltransferase GcvT [bacterium]|nr:glycine cleavage system aminomethyltransferase GcvT [bacterium]